MTDVYSIWKGPTYQPYSPNDMMADALNQPMGFLDTLSDQFVGGITDSPALGTTIRNLSIPEGATTIHLRGEREESFQARRDAAQPITQDEYKASPYYRKDIPFDAHMTEDRAAALAEWYDAKKTREYFASKRPYTSFVGSLAGQAVDPINYIPVAGPLVKGAAVARLGRIGGEVAAASLDAVSNTAVGQALSYEDRVKFGDDVSWQSTVSELAMAGLIGGAFGALHGTMDLYRESKATARIAEQRKLVTDQLSTLENTQNARIALNDAIDNVVRGEEVSLSPNSIEPIGRIADELNPAFRPYTLGKADRAELFSGTATRLSSDVPTVTGAPALRQLAGRPVDTRPPLVQDFEQAIRQQVFDAAPEIGARYQALEQKFSDAAARLDALEQPLAARRPSDTVRLVDPESADRLSAVEDELAKTLPAKRRQALEAERDSIVESIGTDVLAKAEKDFRIGPEKRANQARKALSTARQQFAKVSAQVDTAGKTLMAARRPVFQTRIDSSTVKPEPTPTGVKEAAARMMKVEDTKGLAEQFGVKIEKAKAEPAPSNETSPRPTIMQPAIMQEGDANFAALKPHMQGIERDWRFANSLGIVDDIEALSAKGLTAQQIVKSLGERMKRVEELAIMNDEAVFAGRNKEQMVRSVRSKLDIPSMDDKTEFARWLRDFQARSPAAAPPAKSNPVPTEKASFVEQSDIDQLRAEGRLTEADEANLEDAETTFQNSVAFGEALKTAVACII